MSGVASYVRTHRHWRVLHVERSLSETLPSYLKDFKADGVLARVYTQRMARSVDKLGIPTVDMMGAFLPANGGSLDTDPYECARLAADHFISRGFRQMAFCGYPGFRFSDRRSRCFTEYLAEKGYEAAVFEHSASNYSIQDIVSCERGGELSEDDVVSWLKSLSKPVAILAHNDIRGRQVLAACEQAGLRVPDDVAVLGIDNDEVICDLSIPPLSSIEPDTRLIGYEGAAMLDRLMEGEAAPDTAVLIPPKQIHIRQSTDVLAVEDREMAAALRFVRDHACDRINVGIVAEKLAMSRTTLDRRFHQILGRSVKAEIDRIRVERAKQLLDETDYKISSIAEMTGYSIAAQFVTAFKRLAGLTPGEYRKRGRQIS